MGKIFDELDDRLIEFIARQHMFFVATAPAGPEGHVNLSPKGPDSLRVLGPKQVAYQDLIGSGAETIAHLRQNGRITIMFCAFEGPAKILRLYGQGRTFEPGSAEFEAIADQFPSRMNCRSIIKIEVERIADSCGYGIPFYDLKSRRDALAQWAENMGPDRLETFKEEYNARSIDGLPALG